MGELLTVREVATLYDKAERSIRRYIADGSLEYQEVDDPANKIREYRIPIRALPAHLQARYYTECAHEIAPAAPTQKVARAIEQYTAEERESIRVWSQLLMEWQQYRNDPAHTSKTAVDKQFVAMIRLRRPDINISEGTLYRKWRAYRDGDMDGLIDRRGQWRTGKYEMHPRLWEMFQDYYLDQRQYPISKCVEYVEMWATEYYPELAAQMPSYHSFRRRLLQEIPKAVIELGRVGEKGYADRCAPFVVRYYDDLRSNEYWIADNHTFDVITQDGTGKQHRLYLTAFIDARSGMFTGWCVTDSPSSDSTLLALRHGILRCGIPENIYLDNGREFLNCDIGGLGHRQKASTKGQFTPPPIFARLGINMVNSIVRNAKAKPIERTFGTVKNIVSRAFATYTGGNVLEKPQNLSHRLKEGIPLDAELRAAVDAILDGYYNMGAYGGQVKADHSKTRIEVFNENLSRKRVAGADDLNLLLLRTSKPQTIGRNGVCVTLFGEKVYFWSEQTHFAQGKKVYVRYNPSDLAEVRIYDAETDCYMMSAPMHRDSVLRFGEPNKEAIAQAMRVQRAARRATKAQLEARRGQSVDDRIDALTLTINQAHRNIEHMQIGSGKVLEIVRAQEQPASPMVINGGPAVVIDRQRMIRNAEKREE